MGKIILGASEVKKIYLGSQEVSKVYLGDVEVWSASRLPDWLLYQNELLPLLESQPKYSDYYVDLAYEISNPVIRFEYYRVFTNALTPCQISSSNNRYSVLQVPYDSSYRGFNTITLFRRTDGANGWYRAEIRTSTDRGETEFANSTFIHRAIIKSTIPQFTNGTGVSFEDYR